MQFAKLFLFLVCIMSIALCENSDAADKILADSKFPLMDDVKIKAPTVDIPNEIAAFSGSWVGKWSDYATETALIVEEVNTDHAKIIYCLGESSGLYALPPSCNRHQAKVSLENNQIEFPVGDSLYYVFTMKKTLTQIEAVKKSPLDVIGIIMDKIK